MRVLVADDSVVYRKSLSSILTGWGYAVQQASDGDDALAQLLASDGPRLALIDPKMPGINQADICRTVRRSDTEYFRYLILLTTGESKADVAAGLDAGADDYVVKPFDHQELRQRMLAGERIVKLETAKHKQIAELTAALDDNKQLRGILPICAWCNRIRDDQAYWRRVEDYFGKYSKTEFAHAICPECNTRDLTSPAEPTVPAPVK
ncbi:MAG: response regulator transcription factor [bacterium]